MTDPFPSGCSSQQLVIVGLLAWGGSLWEHPPAHEGHLAGRAGCPVETGSVGTAMAQARTQTYI